MKSLYESILSSNNAGKYSVGRHIIEDDVPCSVIWNDKEKVILISDIYCGKLKGKPYFKENNDIDGSNFLYYEWKKPTKNTDLPIKNWIWPQYDELLADDKIRKQLNELLLKGDNFSCIKNCWVERDNIFGVYGAQFDAFLRVSKYDAGIRFMKIIKLNK